MKYERTKGQQFIMRYVFRSICLERKQKRDIVSGNYGTQPIECHEIRPQFQHEYEENKKNCFDICVHFFQYGMIVNRAVLNQNTLRARVRKLVSSSAL